MQAVLRKSAERGRADFGWLDSRHTFSFGHYHDPKHMGFGPLRVINDDRVAPGGGFPTHPHSDMEIVTYVLSGALEHKDSLGTGSVIRPGDVQRMSAGRGIRHSEFNASQSEPVHFLQIWILPERRGLTPSYEQKTFSAADKTGRLRLIGARDGRNGAVVIHQDADLHATILEPGMAVAHRLAAGRLAWLQVARGAIDVSGHALQAGDGMAISTTRQTGPDSDGELVLEGRESAEVLLFDMAA